MFRRENFGLWLLPHDCHEFEYNKRIGPNCNGDSFSFRVTIIIVDVTDSQFRTNIVDREIAVD